MNDHSGDSKSTEKRHHKTSEYETQKLNRNCLSSVSNIHKRMLCRVKISMPKSETKSNSPKKKLQ